MAPTSSTATLGRTELQQKQNGRQPVSALVANGVAELLQQSGCHSQAALQALMQVSSDLILTMQANPASDEL